MDSGAAGDGTSPGAPAGADAQGPERCGVVALAGRANVGKSTLLNGMIGRKVSIVSDKPQTTRAPVRAVLTSGHAQAVFIDTPGLHKPRTLLGQRVNRAALDAVEDVDVVMLVVDGRAGVGGGDRFVADRLSRRDICVLNKTDGTRREDVLSQLTALGEWGFDEYFAVSARTGAGVGRLVEALLRRLPEGPMLYPADSMGGPGREADDSAGTAHQGGRGGGGGRSSRPGGRGPAGPPLPGAHPSPAADDEVLFVRDMGEAEWVAELVREQLLAITRDELPYSIACQVTEWEWPYVRCEVLVERDSQKGIVIGHGGQVLKRVGTAVRAQLPPGTYLDLSVRVVRDWQHKPEMLKRLGL
jgi:GTP-binding protein Era